MSASHFAAHARMVRLAHTAAHARAHAKAGQLQVGSAERHGFEGIELSPDRSAANANVGATASAPQRRRNI
jgi:hypothetical protein